jgi:putative hemolysin
VTITLEVLILLILILCNGFLAMSEISVVSARTALLRKRADEGDHGAQIALEMADDPGNFLSSVQIGITLVGILAGVFGGATLARVITRALAQIEFLTPYAESISLFLVVIFITYLTVVLGEIVPKRIGLSRADSIAARIAPPVNTISRLTRPFVVLLNQSSNLVLRLLRIDESDEPSVTDDEIRILLAQGRHAGVFEPIEESIVDQVLRLSDRTVSALMTPRTEIEWIDLTESFQLDTTDLGGEGYSRYPAADGDLDRIAGILRVRDLTRQEVNSADALREYLHAPVFVPESMPAFALLERLRSTGAKMALVVDEYGGVAGLVTINDIVSAIVGELPGAAPLPEPTARQREDGSWLIDGMLPLDEFERILDLRDVQDSFDGNVQTLGGFVMANFGRIPTAGDSFVWQEYRFEVVDMDDRRVDKVLVSQEEATAVDRE